MQVRTKMKRKSFNAGYLVALAVAKFKFSARNRSFHRAKKKNPVSEEETGLSDITYQTYLSVKVITK
jgi:hypothetical protein